MFRHTGFWLAFDAINRPIYQRKHTQLMINSYQVWDFLLLCV